MFFFCHPEQCLDCLWKQTPNFNISLESVLQVELGQSFSVKISGCHLVLWVQEVELKVSGDLAGGERVVPTVLALALFFFIVLDLWQKRKLIYSVINSRTAKAGISKEPALGIWGIVYHYLSSLLHCWWFQWDYFGLNLSYSFISNFSYIVM